MGSRYPARIACFSLLVLAGAAIAQPPQLHYDELSSAKMAELRAAAEKGGAFAADRYANACEGRLDLTNALIWYRSAAEQGVANSQANLARMLLARAQDASGKVVSPEQADEAIGWYVKAAGFGNRRAQFELGRYYESGAVVAQDLPEAYKLYSLAKTGGGRDIGARTSVQRVINSMTPEQLAEGKRRFEKFHVQLEPALVNEIKLEKLGGEGKRQRATINGREFKAGDEQELGLQDRKVKVRCIEIREASVLVSIAGVDKVRELKVP